MTMELFHRIADADSAAVRRLVLELQLKDQIDFRNVDTGETALADWRARGGEKIPSLWTGDELIQGRQAIDDYLRWATGEPFPELLRNFDEIAADVWGGLAAMIPEEFAGPISKLQFIVMDEPSDEVLADLPADLAEYPDEICGLHVGTPITESLISSPDPLPVRVYLFRWALIDLLDPEDPEPEASLREEIAITLLHEIGHYFGLSEDDLERLGYD